MSTRTSDPLEWHLQPGPEGYWIVDEYGEDVHFAGRDIDHAKTVLDDMIADELLAREENGPTDKQFIRVFGPPQ